MNTGKIEVSSRFLKDLAIITMLINHACIVFMQAYNYTGIWNHIQWYATRVAFVLFAFMISEGMYKTHDRSKYLFRLGLLALISEIPYDLCFNGVIYMPGDPNIFFTLFLGALGIRIIEEYAELWKRLVICAVILFIGYGLEYSVVGLGIILAFYFLRKKPVLMYVTVALLLLFCFPLSSLAYLKECEYNIPLYLSIFDYSHFGSSYEQFFGILAFPFIMLYKGKKGNSKMPAWFFYAFYPAHLIILFVLVKLIHG